jgi:GR25 family glycosyltransferase involved in LPS biosynthesis
LYKWACLHTSVCDKPAPQYKDVALSAELYTINLEKDTDRKEHMEHQLALVGYDQARVHHFDGAKDAHGDHRRMVSHMAVLEMISHGDAPFAIVMEDDFTFFDAEQAALQLKRAMLLSIGWTVILLSCSNPEGVRSAAFNVSDDPRAASAVLSRFAPTGEGNSCATETLSDHFGTSVSCQGTSGYMIAKSYAPMLLARFEDAEASSQKSSSATDWKDTIDTIWKVLQGADRWLTTVPALGASLGAWEYPAQAGYPDYDPPWRRLAGLEKVQSGKRVTADDPNSLSP